VTALCGYAVDDAGVATITLLRPEARNALNVELLEQLVSALERARADAARVTVLAGEGPVFCAGADVKSDDGTASGRPGLRRQLIETSLELIDALPLSLSAVRGAAVGGGWALALATDICFCTPGSVFRFPELRLGLLPPASTVRRLTAAVGPNVALSALLVDRPWQAEELQRLGLVELVEKGEQAVHITSVARGLAEKDVGLVTRAKKLVHRRTEGDT
jgi:enoyl-CoA hydratase/carnithine racemase